MIRAAAPPATEPPSRTDSGRIARIRAQDGIQLAARIFDAAPGRLPLLCLAGLSRNSRDFSALGQYFAGHPDQPRKVVALDYRGRGRSDPSPDWRSYTPLLEAQDVMVAAAALGLEEAVVVGTSRGGIIAMLLGALRPGLLRGVVLNDIGPVVEGTGLARIKRYLSARRTLESFDEAVAAVRDVGGPHFPALGMADWRAFAEATFRPTSGGFAPDFDPNLTRLFDNPDFLEKIPVLWPQFEGLATIPVLAIRGALSDILSARTLKAMAERHPRFENWTVAGQGHAPLLRDLPTLERILDFARRCDP